MMFDKKTKLRIFIKDKKVYQYPSLNNREIEQAVIYFSQDEKKADLEITRGDKTITLKNKKYSMRMTRRGITEYYF